MIGNLVLAVSSAWIAMALWPGVGTSRGVAGAFVVLSLWQLYCAANASRRAGSPVVLRLGGFAWRMEDFCRGWLITGQIGTGKTVAAVNTMLWQLSKNCPTWGGVCVDDKGLYWETLVPMLRRLGREQDLILLQVRPVDAPPDWTPAHTFNFLDDPHLPYSAGVWRGSDYRIGTHDHEFGLPLCCHGGARKNSGRQAVENAPGCTEEIWYIGRR